MLHRDLDLDVLVCRSFVKAHDRTHSREVAPSQVNMQIRWS